MTELKEKIIIAIDGYSSCGKSSFAKLIAKELGYIYIDSGAMYRAVSLYALQEGLINESSINEKALVRQLSKIKISFTSNNGENNTVLNNRNVEKQIRNIEVSSVVSRISVLREVRERLVQLQRELARNKEVVMDGRDIGTVVFPNAEIKIFMTAEIGIRAKRRFYELQEKGMPASLEDIEENIKKRDHIDTHREHSPLEKAKDALILDNSHMTFDEQMSWFRDQLVKKDLLKK